MTIIRPGQVKTDSQRIDDQSVIYRHFYLFLFFILFVVVIMYAKQSHNMWTT